jgi:cobalt-zinc-cadmium efflux system protein
MEQTHVHTHDIHLSNAFKTSIIINIIYIAIEATSGFKSNSMSLVADAGHNLSDVLALILSWVAVLLSQRKPTMKFTYGFRRSTILITFLNILLLLSAVIFILHEAIVRINETSRVNTKNVMIVATAGILVNAFTAWLFKKDMKQDLNIRSAFIHFIADTLVSLGVLAGGFIISITGLQIIDPIISFIIIAFILYVSYKILFDSINLALDAVPDNINIEEVREFLLKLPEVTGIHDLHIWALSTTDSALTVHLTTSEQTEVNFVASIQQALRERFNIGHSTIQVEFGSIEEFDINN